MLFASLLRIRSGVSHFSNSALSTSCRSKITHYLAHLNDAHESLIEATPASTLLQIADHLDSLSARGPLWCVLAAVKDNIETAYPKYALKTTAGNIALESLLPNPSQSAPFLQYLEEAGIVIIGKANMDDFALSYHSLSTRLGQTLYPYDKKRYPGGSSGGSAVAVATGVAELGIGTDTGGSVRIPASFNGLFGLRPTQGAISTAGVIPLSTSRDTVGFMARSVHLVQAAFEIASGRPRCADRIGKLRVGALEDLFESDTFADALARLQAEPVKNIEGVTMTMLAKQKSLSVFEFRRDVEQYFAVRGEPQLTMAKVVERTRRGCDGSETCSRIVESIEVKLVARTLPKSYVQAWAELRTKLLGLLADFDVLTYPTFSQQPSLLSKVKQAFCPLNRLAANSGLPALTVPVAMRGGLPAGLELMANPGQECVLFHAARQLQPLVESK